MKKPTSRTVFLSAIVFASASLLWQSSLGARQTAAPQTPSPAQNQQPAQQGQQQQDEQKPNYSISMTVPIVNVDAVVTDNDGNYLNGLKKENFRIFEDGKPQTITNFATGDAPITVVVLVEYSRFAYGWYLNNARSWADVFLHQLKPNDWVALASFAMRPNVEVDFTHSARDIEQGLISMSMPTFTESCIFDALLDTVDRLHDVKGKKAILVLASGVDTFSKATLNDTLEKLKETDVSIFAVGVAEQAQMAADLHGGTESLTYLQAQNQMRTFSSLTGGRAWFPRFDGEIPGIMSDVAGSLRNQYSIAYSPTNTNNDGKYRKIKVELVAPDGSPLVVNDQKGKKIKYQVYARQGYVAPKTGAAQLQSPVNGVQSASLGLRAH